MKIAIISDVHGNYPALYEVINEIKRHNCEEIISLGDVAGYYSMINECIDLLRQEGVINILGNHDQYLIQDMGCPRSNSANRCLDFQKQVISDENMSWLKKSVVRYEFEKILMTHGGFYEGIDEYLRIINGDYFKTFNYRYFFSGHTHIPILYKWEDKVYCNPGSVGQPRNGDWRASFAIMEGDNITLHQIEYEVDKIVENMKLAGFNEYFTANLYKGEMIGGGYYITEQDKSGISIVRRL